MKKQRVSCSCMMDRGDNGGHRGHKFPGIVLKVIHSVGQCHGFGGNVFSMVHLDDFFFFFQ